jgi:purine-binding chemotaxis protein CheW
MNLRGHISTVIDLSARLGLGHVDLSGDKRIIIVEWLGERVGLVVDTMEDVLSVDREAIGPAPENVRSAQSHRMLGVFRNGDRIVAMLDLDKVLSSKATAIRARPVQREAWPGKAATCLSLGTLTERTDGTSNPGRG